MLPSSTKYGRSVRLIVSTTSGSAACTRSRTSRQIACCQAGKASMKASTRGSELAGMRSILPRLHAHRCAERREAERREAERPRGREAERREADRREADRREAERREAER